MSTHANFIFDTTNIENNQDTLFDEFFFSFIFDDKYKSFIDGKQTWIVIFFLQKKRTEMTHIHKI